MAFFPCTRFESKIIIHFQGNAYQMKTYTDEQKLENSMRLHKELSENYDLISKLAVIVLRKNLRMVFENPANNDHYLTRYWPIKPKIIDRNRRDNGDYMIKPTQYWFIGFEPKSNLIFEALDDVELRLNDKMQAKDGRSRAERRSEIHPQYASRFIRQYLIDEKEVTA